MKRLVYFFPLFCVLLSSCRKQDTTVKIAYDIKELSSDNPSYTITYTSDKSGNSKQVSTSDPLWNSGYIELPKGEYVSLRVDCSAPLYEFRISIYQEGVSVQETELFNPRGSASVSFTTGN
ncbi:MAG TPA: hypothetical protein VFU15_00640 [Bacteroidia bacterium]|nr:hypothetical protein [Bacteroidia bacterium]